MAGARPDVCSAPNGRQLGARRTGDQHAYQYGTTDVFVDAGRGGMMQGEDISGNECYFIVSGSVDICVTAPDGSKSVLETRQVPP